MDYDDYNDNDYDDENHDNDNDDNDEMTMLMINVTSVQSGSPPD